MAWPDNNRHERSLLGSRDISSTKYVFSPPRISSSLNSILAYYLPKSAISIPLTATKRSTFCEWKGWATYYNIKSPSNNEEVSNRIWSYEDPTPGYKDIKSYVSFYAGPWDCYVDGELVKPQPGDFYGGWMTSELEGTIKGDATTRWM